MTPMWVIGMRTEHGATLIELLVVLGILALLAGAGVLVVGTLEARRLDRECVAAYKWLRNARRHAMLTGTVSTIIARGGQLRTSSRIRPLELKRPRGIEMALGNFGTPSDSLCFFPDGSGCAGYIEVADNRMKRRITIDRFGEIAIE